MPASPPLRIGFVPEHFSTPLHYAVSRFGLAASVLPFPSGTGAMIAALRAGELDAAIGLTEGWVAGLGTKTATAAPGGSTAGGYQLVARYVDSPLCWAISTGADREEVATAGLPGLRGTRLGVSRFGSGSHVMGYVLADQQGWLDGGNAEPYAAVVPLQTFVGLREAVGSGAAADFFMWEHFTSKRYYAGPDAPPASQHLIRKVGEIYTPWPSWHIVAVDAADARLQGLYDALDEGIRYFNANPKENVEYISTALDYTKEDAEEWLKTVTFSKGVRGVKKSVIGDTIKTLQKAGVLVQSADDAQAMIGTELAE